MSLAFVYYVTFGETDVGVAKTRLI